MQKYLFIPQNCQLLKATVSTVTVVSRKPAGWLIEDARRERSSYFFHAPSAPRPLSNTAIPGIYMYVVSAKIPFYPSKLSTPQSYCQHGYCGISETRGFVDGERPSHFLHVPSAPRPLSNTASPGIYMYFVTEKYLICPQNYLLLQATANTVTAVFRKPAGD